MASLFASLSKEIFQILKGSGRTLSLYDEYGSKVFDPETAISFFAEPDKLMLNIESNGADSAINVYLSDATNASDVSDLLDLLRKISTRYNLLFNVRKYGKTLEPKDFAFKALPVTEDVENVMESMWGSTKTSYQRIGSTRLIIRHSDRVSEEVRGARSRKIHSIFIETSSGERIKFPVPNLHGARAYASHLDAGGNHHDDLAELIISECETQTKYGNVRKFLRKLPEQTEYTTNLNEILTQAQDASKKKITRMRGKRFYNDVLEDIQIAQNVLGPMESEIALEVENLVEQLGIDETHSLYPVLETVAKTVLENNAMDHTNFDDEVISHTFVCESDEIIESLIETFVEEFGLEENTHFMRHGSRLVALDETLAEKAKVFTEGLAGLAVIEEAQDKFLTYAKQWNIARMKDAGMTAAEMGDLDKQSMELAQGLKDVIAGRISPKLSVRELPRFSNKADEVAYKLDLLGVPGAGIQNDSLANFIGTISDKITNGKGIDSNERFFASKLADLVDAAVVSETTLPEETALEDWLCTFDLTEVMPSPDDMQDMTWKFPTNEFLDYFIKFQFPKEGDLQMAHPDDLVFSKNYIRDLIRNFIAETHDIQVYDLDIHDAQIDEILDELVIPVFAESGFDITEVNESFNYAEFNENFDESNKLPAEMRERVIEVLNQINLDDYYGIVSGDDADDDSYALVSTLTRHIGEEAEAMGIDFLDHVDEIAQLAYAILTKDWPAKEIDEAGNYPDDYNASRDPHAGPDTSEEESNLLYVAREAIEDLIYGQDNIVGHLTTKSFQDPEDSPELILDELADDVAGSAAKRAARSSDEYWAEDFLFDKDTMGYLKKLALIELRKHFQLDVKEDINEYDERQVNSINMHMVNDTLTDILNKSEIGPQEDIFVDNIMAKLRDDFSYSLQFTKAINANVDAIRSRIEQFYKSEAKTGEIAECDIIPGDDGDKFDKDVTYVNHQELERLARLKRLAGLN